jgi:hypothetical protein
MPLLLPTWQRRRPSGSRSQEFHELFHFAPDTSRHIGTARNATGLYMLDVVEIPECVRGSESVPKVEVEGSTPFTRSEDG